MTTEEKARAYDEALEVMRQWIAPCHTKEQLDALKKSVFPELAESEDERIRKWLYDYINSYPSDSFAFCGVVRKDAVLNYLEKQKEQKPEGVYVNCTEHPEWYGMPPKEQKQELSEEDKRILRRIIERLSVDKNIGLFEFKEMETFLNSYRP